MAEDIIKHVFFRPGSAIILVFLTSSANTQFQEEPVSLGAKYTGIGKNCDFRLKSPFRPIVAIERQYEVIAGGSTRVRYDDLE